LSRARAIARLERLSLLPYQLLKLILRQHLHAEFAGLVELTAGFLAGDDVVGFLRHAARSLATQALDQAFDIFAASTRMRAGADEWLPRHVRAVPGGRLALLPLRQLDTERTKVFD